MNDADPIGELLQNLYIDSAVKRKADEISPEANANVDGEQQSGLQQYIDMDFNELNRLCVEAESGPLTEENRRFLDAVVNNDAMWTKRNEREWPEYQKYRNPLMYARQVNEYFHRVLVNDWPLSRAVKEDPRVTDLTIVGKNKPIYLLTYNKYLTSLHIENNYNNTSNTAEIRRDLEQALNNGLFNLERLSLKNVLLTESFINLVALQSRSIIRLSLIRCRLSSSMLRPFASMIKRMKVIDLSKNDFGNSGVKFLANVRTDALYLNSCLVGNEGLRKLAQNSNLVDLKLNNNSTIDDTGIVSLQINTTLKKIQFAGMTISSVGFFTLSQIQQLETLLVGYFRNARPGDVLNSFLSNVSKTNFKHFYCSKYMLGQDTTWYKSLMSLTALMVLHLTHAMLGNEEALEMSSKLTNLNVLNVSNNHIGALGVQALLKLPNLKLLTANNNYFSATDLNNIQIRDSLTFDY